MTHCEELQLAVWEALGRFFDSLERENCSTRPICADLSDPRYFNLCRLEDRYDAVGAYLEFRKRTIMGEWTRTGAAR